jgi:hypothetical protein
VTGRWDNLLTLMNRTCLATFGVPVVYTPSMETRMELGGTPIALEGVFDEKWENVTLMGTNGMDAVVPHPVVEIRVFDLGIDPMAEDEVAINGLSYRILDVQLDGKGMAMLHLAQIVDPLAV